MLFKSNNYKTFPILTIGLLCLLRAHAQYYSDGDFSLPPNSFTLEFLTVYYEFSANNTITMAIKNNIPDRYFALGLGTSMLDADVWVFEFADFENSLEITAKDYWSPTRVYPILDTDRGCQENLERLGYEIHPLYTLIKIRRALDTGDGLCDEVIQPGLTNFVYASAKSYSLFDHGPLRGTAQIELVENSPPVVAEEEASILEEFNEGGNLEEVRRLCRRMFGEGGLEF